MLIFRPKAVSVSRIRRAERQAWLGAEARPAGEPVASEDAMLRRCLDSSCADMVVLVLSLLLGELQTHDIFVGRRRAVDGEARGVGPRCLRLFSIAVISLPTLVAAVTMNEDGIRTLSSSPYFAPLELRQGQFHIGPQIPFGHGGMSAPIRRACTRHRAGTSRRDGRAVTSVLLERASASPSVIRQLLTCLPASIAGRCCAPRLPRIELVLEPVVHALSRLQP